MSIFTLAFAKAAGERAVKSAAQALVLLLVAGDKALDAFSVDYQQAAGIALGAAGLSVLTSIISAPFGPSGPSLGGETTVPEDVQVVHGGGKVDPIGEQNEGGVDPSTFP